jgi:hypothetical protein
MKPTIIEQCRAYLCFAGLSAAFIQAVVLISIFVLRVPQDVFTTPAFHIGVVPAIAGLTWILRHLARGAFRDTLSSGPAHLTDWESRTVTLSAPCPPCNEP